MITYKDCQSNYRFRFNIALFLILFLFLGSHVHSQNSSDPENNMTMKDFLQQGTLHGLNKNAISKKLVKTLLNDYELWVGKCPICDEVRRGFKMYISQDNQNHNPKALKEDILTGLKSDSLENRKASLKKLIDQYTQEYYIVLGLSEAQRKTMESELLEAREVGMKRATNGKEIKGFYCSSCDGACHKPNTLSNNENQIPVDIINISQEETFTSLEYALANKEKAIALDLANQELSELPADIGELTNLKYLNLSNNKLQSLPSEISKLHKLEVLDINSNAFHHRVLYQVAEISALKKLNLSHNEIQDLPSIIEQLENLEFLDLSSTTLKNLPESIGELKQLQQIHLNNNPIEMLPESISKLTFLNEVMLKETLISDTNKLAIENLLPACSIIYE